MWALEITYRNKQVEQVCTDGAAAQKEYGKQMAQKIHQRVDEITAADSVEMLVRFKIGRCHPLTQNRAGQYAMDLVQPYRLVFIRVENQLQVVEILEIVDYH